jgi:hypothetical protein
VSFQALVEATITVRRITRVMRLYQFVLGIVLGFYVGFQRLNQLCFLARDPLLTGILKVSQLPPQSTLWRFLASLHLNVARQILAMQRTLRERAQRAPRPFWARRGSTSGASCATGTGPPARWKSPGACGKRPDTLHRLRPSTRSTPTYSNDVMPEVPKGLCDFLVQHLVEEKAEPLHACSGSSSVCSMTEWQ